MKAIGTNRAPGMLLCPSLICVSQKKTTIFRLVKVTSLDRPTGQKLLESLICTSLKIVTFVWEMVCTLSTLFYHLQKRQQAHRPRRRGLVGPLLVTFLSPHSFLQRPKRLSIIIFQENHYPCRKFH